MSIASAILAVSKSVGHIKKDGQAQFGNTSFKFQAWDDVLPEIKKACIEHGLAIIPSVVSINRSVTTYTDNYGKEKQVPKVSCQMEFTLICGDESRTFPYCGEALDTDDKAVQKASTSGTKYWLLKTFMIPSDDPDPDECPGNLDQAKKPKADKDAAPRKREDLHVAISKEWNMTPEQANDMKAYCQGRECKASESIVEAHKAGAKNLNEFYEYMDQTGKFAEATR